MQTTCVNAGSVGRVDARSGASCGGRRCGIPAHSILPRLASARAPLKPAGGHVYAVSGWTSRITTSQERKKRPLSLSKAAFSHGVDKNEKCAGLAKALDDVDDFQGGDGNTFVSVAQCLSFPLKKAIGLLQSIVQFVHVHKGGFLTPPLAISGSSHFNGSKSDTVSMAMSAGIVGVAFTDLTGNLIFMSAFWSWLTAQMMKYVTTFYREGKWDWRVMFDSGGMPSSHTSLVVGLTTAIAYQYGLGSTLFPLSLAFSLIVMYDAAGVRRHAGKQAAVLNKILENMFHGESISEDKLKEVLGHSPLQVLAGAVLGVFIAVMYMHNFGSGYAALA